MLQEIASCASTFRLGEMIREKLLKLVLIIINFQ